MASEVAETILNELHDPRKATSNYLTSVEGKFSWGQTTDKEHHAFLGKMATNDPAESPFALLTHQLQSFGRLLGIHASAVGHARMNKDFTCKIEDCSHDGAYHQLSNEMRQSLLQFALNVAPAVRKSEKISLDKQRDSKRTRQDKLRRKKMLAVQLEYANALTYMDMFHSQACWKSKKDAKAAFKKLNSHAAKLEAVKDQIRIRVIGFGWKDLHHPWSKNGVDYTPDQLLSHLIDRIIPQQNKRGVPEVPPMTLPSRKITKQLGTKTSDIDELDRRYEQEKEGLISEAIKMRDDLEGQGISDRYERMQPPRPEVDANLVGLDIEQLWTFVEEDGTEVLQWCQGTVVAIKTRDRIHIKWREDCLRDGDMPITEEVLKKSKYNKHVEGGWRMSV